MRLILDGDVSAALLAVSDNSPVDLLWGIGGTPEGVISAAAIKCIGGQLLGRLWPRNDDERPAAVEAGYDLERVLSCDDLVRGEDVFFSATGVTDGDVLQGVRYQGDRGATTESLVMRSRSGTVRRVSARHDRAKLRDADRRPLRLIGEALLGLGRSRCCLAAGGLNLAGIIIDSRPIFEVARFELGERAQERVRDEHVDRRLCRLVHRAC